MIEVIVLYLISNKFYFEESKIRITDDQSLKEWKFLKRLNFKFSKKKLDVLEKKYFKEISLWRVLKKPEEFFLINTINIIPIIKSVF